MFSLLPQRFSHPNLSSKGPLYFKSIHCLYGTPEPRKLTSCTSGERLQVRFVRFQPRFKGTKRKQEAQNPTAPRLCNSYAISFYTGAHPCQWPIEVVQTFEKVHTSVAYLYMYCRILNRKELFLFKYQRVERSIRTQCVRESVYPDVYQDTMILINFEVDGKKFVGPSPIF